MSWSDSLRGVFGFLFTRSRAESSVAEYIVREHHRGRAVSEIVDDPYVKNRLSQEQIRRVLERPEVVHAVGTDAAG